MYQLDQYNSLAFKYFYLLTYAFIFGRFETKLVEVKFHLGAEGTAARTQAAMLGNFSSYYFHTKEM
jgi:hypothetical protein